MTHQIASLTWADQSDPNAPIAPYTLDFSVDPVWLFSNLYSSYLQKPIYPLGFIVDNSKNNASIAVQIGPLPVVVQPFQRTAIALPRGSQSVSISCGSTVQAPLEFYILQPAPGADTLNVQGANASMVPQVTTVWTPSDNSIDNLALVINSAHYVQLGPIVWAFYDITYPATASGNAAGLKGLPVPAVTSPDAFSLQPMFLNLSGGVCFSAVNPGNSTTRTIGPNGALLGNANLSGFRITGCIVYRTA